MTTPAGRARIAAEMRAEAAKDRDEALGEAARDRAEELKAQDEKPAGVEARYARATTHAQSQYAKAMDKADRVAAGEPTAPYVKEFDLLGSEEARTATLKALGEPAAGPAPATKDRGEWFKDGLRKAVANPEYYLTVMFAWGHRLAVLLLPIVGLSLALVYMTKRRYFIYDHLLVAMNLLSFAFLTNALGLVLPRPVQPWWFGVVAVWTPINLFQTLRGAYGSSVLGATLKTAVVWFTTVFAFSLLLAGLMIFSMGQL